MNETNFELEPRDEGPQAEMDSLLRSSLASPIPTLSPDFDQRLMQTLRRDAKPLAGYRRILLTGYGLTSVVASAVIMRSQGLDWGIVAGTILAPLAIVAAMRSIWRATHKTMRHTAT